MGNLTIDPLAMAALAGCGSLLIVMAGITLWLVRQSGKASGEK